MGVKLAKISSKYYVSNEKINELQRTLAVARNVRINPLNLFIYPSIYL